MSRHVECSTCKTIRPDTEARNLPRFVAETTSFVDAYYCTEHAPAALAAVQTQVAGFDLENDERDDMTQLLHLMLLLQARGQNFDDLRDDEYDGSGMDRVPQQVLALLRRLEHGAILPIVEPSALCSDCFRALPASQIRVIPWYNESPNDYVTTFRCSECLPKALAETRAHLEAGGDREVTRLSEFFGRHAVTILEYRRGDPAAVVRPILLHMLGMLEAGTMTLQIGETAPLSEIFGEAPEDPSPPQASEQEPEPAARPSLWSRLFGIKPR